MLVDSGADPKSVLCAFYKVGQCVKGDKCKFSHDMTIARKAEKRSMYEDKRDGAAENGKQRHFCQPVHLLFCVAFISGVIRDCLENSGLPCHENCCMLMTWQ